MTEWRDAAIDISGESSSGYTRSEREQRGGESEQFEFEKSNSREEKDTDGPQGRGTHDKTAKDRGKAGEVHRVIARRRHRAASRLPPAAATKKRRRRRDDSSTNLFIFLEWDMPGGVAVWPSIGHLSLVVEPREKRASSLLLGIDSIPLGFYCLGGERLQG